MIPSEYKRRDLDVFPAHDPRYAAASAALQLHGFMDPERAKDLGRYVTDAVLRAGVRPTDGLPTDVEVNRALGALHRRAIEVTRDDIYAALFAAFCEEGHP